MIPTDEITLEKVIAHVVKNAPALPYHNAKHAIEVWASARQYAALESIPYEDRLVLEPAALLHDIILVPGRNDNEEESAAYALRYLPTVGYTMDQAIRAADLILATKLPTRPLNRLEMVLCDSDVDNLGRDLFFEKNEQVRKEVGCPEGNGWYASCIKFLEGHKYYTESAKKLRNGKKQQNLNRLYELAGVDKHGL